MNHHQAPIAANSYLTKIAFEQQSRSWIRRECNVLVNVMLTFKGMGNISQGRLRVCTLSEGGMVASTDRDDVPDYFYISFGEEQYQIGCAIMHREDDLLYVRFIKQQPEAFIHAVASLGDPFALLEKISLALYGLNEEAA